MLNIFPPQISYNSCFFTSPPKGDQPRIGSDRKHIRKPTEEVRTQIFLKIQPYFIILHFFISFWLLNLSLKKIYFRVSKAKPHFDRLLLGRLSPTSAITTMDYKVLKQLPLQLQPSQPGTTRLSTSLTITNIQHMNSKVSDLQRRLNKLLSRTKEKRR